MENVIVTGANGFIGKTLVNALLEKGYHVVALDIRFDDVLANDDRVTCVNVMNKEVAALAKEIPHQEYRCFFHLAWAGTSGPARADYTVQLNNVKLACDYIKLCSEIGCKRVVYASSINEMETYEYLQSDDIEPAGGYIYGTGKLAAHLMGETVAKLNGIEFIPVIITNIYGVGEKSARMTRPSTSWYIRSTAPSRRAIRPTISSISQTLSTPLSLWRKRARRLTATTSAAESRSRCGSSCWRCGTLSTRRQSLAWEIFRLRVWIFPIASSI